MLLLPTPVKSDLQETLSSPKSGGGLRSGLGCTGGFSVLLWLGGPLLAKIARALNKDSQSPAHNKGGGGGLPGKCCRSAHSLPSAVWLPGSRPGPSGRQVVCALQKDPSLPEEAGLDSVKGQTFPFF